MYHSLLKNFPSFVKPSYEIVVHKKDTSIDDKYPLQIAVPFGKKAYLWFTHFNSENVCCIIELSRMQTLQDNVHMVKTEFPPEFALGTLLSGYVLEDENHSNKNVFMADDIFLFKGHAFGNPFPIPLNFKLRAFVDFFKELRVYSNQSSSIFAIAMWQSVEAEERLGNLIGYPIRYIQQRSLEEIVPHLNIIKTKNNWQSPSTSTTTTPQYNNNIWNKKFSLMPTFKLNDLNIRHAHYSGKRLFWIKADLLYDVYHIYDFHRELYQYALIPDIKTSYMMNSIFRKIPENNCLDQIEDSDDEESFENTCECKFIQRKTFVLMDCIFHRKFKKWIPLSEQPIHLSKFVPLLKDLVCKK